jgi:hypothetical protein
LRLVAPIQLLLCLCCTTVSSLLAYCKAVTLCERQRGFPHHSAARVFSCQRTPKSQTT